jgi:hypothetical protein
LTLLFASTFSRSLHLERTVQSILFVRSNVALSAAAWAATRLATLDCCAICSCRVYIIARYLQIYTQTAPQLASGTDATNEDRLLIRSNVDTSEFGRNLDGFEEEGQRSGT